MSAKSLTVAYQVFQKPYRFGAAGAADHGAAEPAMVPALSLSLEALWAEHEGPGMFAFLLLSLCFIIFSKILSWSAKPGGYLVRRGAPKGSAMLLAVTAFADRMDGTF